MIDWLTLECPYDGPRFCNVLTVQDAMTGAVHKREIIGTWITGSYSNKVMVSAIDGNLRINGNPVKWLTGQNYFGTSDAQRLVRATVDVLEKRFGLVPSVATHRAIEDGNVKIGRADCTRHLDQKNDSGVQIFLHALEQQAHARHRGRGHFDKGTSTLYYGRSVSDEGKVKMSRRSALKFYNKHMEMKRRPPTCHHTMIERCMAESLGKVRCEAQYRSLELKRLGYNLLSAWTPETADKLLTQWLGKLEVANNAKINEFNEFELPRKLKGIYVHWANGEDVSELYSKSTLYRYRRELLDDHGIDVFAAPPTEAKRVVPIVEYIRAPFVPEDETTFWDLVAKAA